jgi:hypothetical protein
MVNEIKKLIDWIPFRIGRRFILSSEEAERYCQRECLDEKLGCAVDCRLRKHFGLPPHNF